MRATSTLIRKELRQHWGAFLLLALFFLLLYGFAAFNAWIASGVAGSFAAAAGYLRFFILLPALFISGRLVVTEYRERTQLFLEALPLARVHMLLVKYLLGLVFLFGLAGAVTAVAAFLGRSHEVYTYRFAGILTLSLFAVCFFWHGFFFLTGLTGRYRIAIWVALLIVLPYLQKNSEWDVMAFGPFRLLGDRFGYERELYPVVPLQECFAFGAGFMMLALSLGMINEGSVAGMMGEKMSIREKVLFTALLLGIFMASQSLEVRKPPLPYEPPGAIVEKAGPVTVRATGEPARAKALAARVAVELGALAEALGLREAPPVFLHPRADFARWQFERGILVNTTGVLAQGNYEGADFPEERFVAWIIGEWLDTLPGERAQVEEKRWPRSGAGWYWVRRERSGPPAEERDLMLRALLATEGRPVTETDLRDWFLTSERLGEDVAEGLAWSGLKTLALEKGPAAVTDLLRQLYVVDLPHNFLAIVRDRGNVPAKVLPALTGKSQDTFLTAWNATLETARPALSTALAALPRLGLDLEFVPEGEDTVAVRYRATITPPPTETLTWRLRWSMLRPFDQMVAERDLDDIWHTSAPGESGQWRDLPDRFPADGRIFATLTLECPELGGAVSSGSQRLPVKPPAP